METIKKFELTDESEEINGVTVYRIRACTDFTTVTGREVHKGDLGGFVERESNLSRHGNAWVHDNAKVYGNAWVCDNAEVYENAEVYGNAWVHSHAKVYGNAEVFDNARVWDYAEVYDNAKIYGYAEIYGNAKVYGRAKVYGEAGVYGYAEVSESDIVKEEERKMRQHFCLKIREEFANAILTGEKTFEVRYNDRGFQKGDFVSFICVDEDGNEMADIGIQNYRYEITYVLNGWGLKDGYVAFGIKEVENG